MKLNLFTFNFINDKIKLVVYELGKLNFLQYFILNHHILKIFLEKKCYCYCKIYILSRNCIHPIF